MNGFVSLAVPILNAVAWPLATLAIAALCRRELRLTLNRLIQFKYGGVEVTFRADLDRAEALARALPVLTNPPAPPAGKAGPASTVQFEVAADAGTEPVGTLLQTGHPASGASVRPPGDRRSPRDSILRLWDDLAQCLVQAAGRLGDRRNPVPSRIEPALRFLVGRGYLSGDEGRLVEQLRRLVDQVDRTDGQAPDRADADRFAALIRPVQDRLSRLE